ncbi:hypothetical protein [Absidia glauca]|uniref:Uncharacterized protein n=1 Tax=Absidia glauca TaxID=4829 RepID=A0A168RMM7_ABSGL|nr:hypothetical protein [Absidia glauca]
MIKSMLNQSTIRRIALVSPPSSRMFHRSTIIAAQEEDTERLQDMYNNEKQSVGDELDHPENEHPEVIPTTSSTEENNTEFDE